jgi:hypothetical protein
LVTPQGRPLVLYLWPPLEHVRYGRSVPCLPSSVGFDTVPFLYPLVATFRLVCGLTEALDAFIYSSSLTSFPTIR